RRVHRDRLAGEGAPAAVCRRSVGLAGGLQEDADDGARLVGDVHHQGAAAELDRGQLTGLAFGLDLEDPRELTETPGRGAPSLTESRRAQGRRGVAAERVVRRLEVALTQKLDEAFGHHRASTLPTGASNRKRSQLGSRSVAAASSVSPTPAAPVRM